MELSTNFLLEHTLELRLLIAILAIAVGYGLVRLYMFIGQARDAVLDAYRKATGDKLSADAAGTR